MSTVPRLVVFDFDGTCTDVEKEGEGFISASVESLAELTDRDPLEIQERYAVHEREILENPTAYDWVIDGIAVCPGTLDPYLRSKHVAHRILSESLEGERLREASIVFANRYPQHYAKSGIALRPELPGVLAEFCEEAHVAIVTNSAADAVRKKLQTIPNFDLSRVTLVGGAKKYVAERGLEAYIPGLARGIQLQRPRYRAVLSDLKRQYEVNERQTTVIGDIFELDLALPDHIGMHTVLMAGPHTPAYEIKYMLASSRRCMATSLYEALGFFLAQ